MTETSESVPCGEYMARAIRGTEQYAPSAGGEPQIAIDFAIEGGEHEGASMTIVFSFSGKAPEYSIKKLRACGWQGDNLEDLSGIDALPVAVRVFDDTYTDRRTNETKTRRKMELQWSGDGKFKFEQTMDARQKRGFAAAFAGLAKTIPARAIPGGAPSPSARDDFPPSYAAPTGTSGPAPKY